MRTRTRILAATGAALLATSGAAIVLAAPFASAATAFGVAPYVDMSNNAESVLDDAIKSAGVRYYTAAFVIGAAFSVVGAIAWLGVDAEERFEAPPAMEARQSSLAARSR